MRGGVTPRDRGTPGNVVYLKERGTKSVWRGTPRNAIAIYRGGPPHPGPETIVAPLHVSLKIGLMMLKILLCIIEIMNILKYIRKENSYFIYIILYIF